MRAEMTVGLDIKSLENLRIFNGYETEKKSRRLSIEAPSSPDDNNNESDTGQKEWTPSKGKSKCGRPANPIPRHKRNSHIKAEYKRRDKIQKGFDTLLTLVPELNGVSEKESKAKMLFKTADYCRRLKSECGSTQKELTALRQQLETIGTEIQGLQDKLPNHGVDTVKKCEDVAMDTLFDKYVQEETQKNWKFWIFGFFMHPLYDSFKQKTSGNQDQQEFKSSVFQWLQNCLSLSNLRKGFLEALRKISKHTSIMTNPEQLQQEAATKNRDHCISTKLESLPAALTPPTTPRTPTPAPVSSPKCTPVPTPTPTPPRTPTVSRRSSKREIQRSTESRSRSNSPSLEETKPKRRSNYRSRSNRRSGDDQEMKIEYATTVGNPSLPLLSQLLTSPELVHVSHFGSVTKATVSGNAIMASSHPKSSMETVVSTANQDQLITTFVESLISSMNADTALPKSEPVSPLTTAESSNVFVSLSLDSCTTGTTTASASSSEYKNSDLELMKLDVFGSSASGGFIPLSTSGIISNGSLIQAEDSLTNQLDPLSSLFESSGISDIQPMEIFTSVSNTDQILREMPSLACVSHGQTSAGVCPQNPGNRIPETSTNATRADNRCLLNEDEDSLTALLSIDVMDVSSVMNFFNDDKLCNS